MNKSFDFADLLWLLMIVVSVVSCVSIFYSMLDESDEKYAKYQVAEQRDSRVKDDEYIKSHIHYGKDEFGNCWAWGSHTGLVLMECSKIGR